MRVQQVGEKHEPGGYFLLRNGSFFLALSVVSQPVWSDDEAVRIPVPDSLDALATFFGQRALLDAPLVEHSFHRPTKLAPTPRGRQPPAVT